MKLTHLAVLAFALAACATATGNEGGDAAPPAKDAGAVDSATPKKLPDASAPQDDAGQTTTNDAAPPLDDSTCAALTTKGQCEHCCLKVHPSGYGVYNQELVSCACTSPAACATECASELCASKPTTSGGACETCITASLAQGTGACYEGVSAACQADTDCTALFGTCIPPCESK